MSRYVQELRLEDFEKIRDEIFANSNGDSGHAKFVDLSKRICDGLPVTAACRLP